jgi:hypothetical protein
MLEADIINDCIEVFNDNKEDYFIDLNIVDKIDKYYDNYQDIKNATLNQFINFVKEKTGNNNKNYNSFQLKIWFHSNEFKSRLHNLRDLSDIEYYIYITNKINKNKITKLENKINYIFYSAIISFIIYVSSNLYPNFL